jgi:hypothetical protein
MTPGPVFQDPRDLFTHDHFHLKDLFAEYEQLGPGDWEMKARMIRRIEEELRLHFRIEERLLYPSLQSVKSKAVEELVRTARNEHKDILAACRHVAQADENEQGTLMKALFKQVGLYADFEEKRLLPWTRSLPGVTLREMTLEIEEMEGRKH